MLGFTRKKPALVKIFAYGLGCVLYDLEDEGGPGLTIISRSILNIETPL